MENIKCQYLFLARTAIRNAETKEIEFKAIKEIFENENPILAREAAFAFRNKFIYGILSLGLGLTDEEIGWNFTDCKIEKLSEREIRKLLNPYLEQEEETDRTLLRQQDQEEQEIEWQAPDDTLSWYTKFNNGIWIVFQHNDFVLHEKCYGDDDVVIDKISRYEEPLPSPPNYLNLKEELAFYRKYDYDTKDYETSFFFFDDETYREGGYEIEGETEEEASERAEEEALIEIECLKTPFDWTGYDMIYWWEKIEDDYSPREDIVYKTERILPITMYDALNEGESQHCEFKPGLTNRPNSNRDMELEVAQAICAFLNSEGGYLFIGVSDKQEIIGIDFTKISVDKFKREYTRIKAMFLPPHIAHTIYGRLYTSNEGKDIFVITVFPNSNGPVFLKRKDDNGKFLKEFHVRSDASTRHIYDIEEVVKYCKTHWNWK